MKRREIKFVAGSLPLAPDRIETMRHKSPSGLRRGAGAAGPEARMSAARRSARKRR